MFFVKKIFLDIYDEYDIIIHAISEISICFRSCIPCSRQTKKPYIFFDAEISNNTYSFNSGCRVDFFSSAVKRYSCIHLYIYFNFFALNGLIVHHNCIPRPVCTTVCWDKGNPIGFFTKIRYNNASKRCIITSRHPLMPPLA